jgi:SAM-dependent methyltransferase
MGEKGTMELKMFPRDCAVCGSTDTTHVAVEADFDPVAWNAYAFASRKIPEYMHYRLLLCPTCDLLYANPVPDLQMIATAYEEAAFDSGVEAGWAARTYSALLPELIQCFPDRAGALDIGTGDGAFLTELLAHNFTEVKGVEPSSAPIATASDTIRPLIQHGLFDSVAFGQERFRLITCFQTIEHVYEPMAICRDAYHLLKDGGAFVLICHNRRSLVNRALGLKSPIFDIEHLQLFSPQSVRIMLERAGYHHVIVKPITNRYPLRYWMRLFPLPSKIKGRLLAWLSKSPLGSFPIALPVGNLVAVGYK